MADMHSEKLFANGILLFDKVLKETNLLINEDACLLKSAFDHQSELQQKRIQSSQSKQSNSVISITICSSAALICLVAISVGTDLLTVKIGLLLTFVNIVIAVLIIYILLAKEKDSLQVFNALFEKLIVKINDEKQSFKKLKELIDDNWSHSNNEDQKKRLNKLKIGFREVGLKCLLELRHCTLLIKDKLPLRSDVDDNLISTLPDDLFESYNNDEELDAKVLKSLRQLIRLQISEFFTRILLLFIQNYHLNPSQYEQSVALVIDAGILKNILNNSNERQNEIMSIISFHKSFYEVNISAQSIKKETESATVWQGCRNVRQTLYRTFSIIDECETILDQKCDLNNQSKLDLISKFELINDDLANARDIISGFQKTLQLKMIDSSTINDPKLSSLQESKVDDENCHKNRPLLSSEHDPPKDEVFEAFIEEIPKIESVDKNSDLDFPNLEIRNAENNVFWELKKALKDKAIEHKMREAKALGKKVDMAEIEQECMENLNNQGTMDKNDIKHVIKCDQIKDDKIIPNDLKLELNLNIAKQAANQMKLRFNFDEETFGESDDDDDDDEQTD